MLHTTRWVISSCNLIPGVHLGKSPRGVGWGKSTLEDIGGGGGRGGMCIVNSIQIEGLKFPRFSGGGGGGGGSCPPNEALDSKTYC